MEGWMERRGKEGRMDRLFFVFLILIIAGAPLPFQLKWLVDFSSLVLGPWIPLHAISLVKKAVLVKEWQRMGDPSAERIELETHCNLSKVKKHHSKFHQVNQVPQSDDQSRWWPWKIVSHSRFMFKVQPGSSQLISAPDLDWVRIFLCLCQDNFFQP